MFNDPGIAFVVGIVVIALIVKVWRSVNRPKMDAPFRCARCGKPQRHTARTIQAWQRGRRLHCGWCHARWLHTRDVIRNIALALFVLLVILGYMLS